MARSFNGTSDFLQYDNPVLTAMPITMSCWFLPTDTVTDGAMTWLGNSAAVGGRDSFHMRAQTADSILVAYIADSSSINSVSGPTTYSTNTWNHACATFNTGIDVSTFVNGTKFSTTGLGGSGPSGVNRAVIGKRNGAASDKFFKGNLADAALWNVILSDDEVTSLARGESPLRVRPSSLVAYWPMWGINSPELDMHPVGLNSAQYNMTVTGTAAVSGPPVTPFSSRYWGRYLTLIPPRNQSAYRFRNDDGSESTATWKAAENVNVSSAIYIPLRLRTQMDTTIDAPSEQVVLQFRKTGGTWQTVKKDNT